MPVLVCDQCKLQFSEPPTNRKMTSCPTCGAAVIIPAGSTTPPLPGSAGNSPKRTAPPPLQATVFEPNPPVSPKPKPAAPPKPPVSAPRPAPRPQQANQGKKSSLPLLLGIGFFLMIGAVAAGTAVWYFGFRKTTEVVKDEPKKEEPAPAPEPKETQAEFPKIQYGPPPRVEGNDIYKLLLPSTVLISTKKGIGSGVLVCQYPPLVVTNNHVVGTERSVEVQFPRFAQNGQVIKDKGLYTRSAGSRVILGRVLDISATQDLALIELEYVPDSAKPVPFAADSAQPLERVYGIGASSFDLNTLWQAHEGAVRQVMPRQKLFKSSPLHCRLMVSQQPTFFGDSGGPIVNANLQLVAVVQGGMPAEGELVRDGKGKPVVQVDTREGMALNVDVSEIREFVDGVYRRNYSGSFPLAPPIFEAGIVPPPPDETLTVGDYIRIFRGGDPAQVRLAMDRLIFRGGQSVTPLKDLLEDPKVRNRWAQALFVLEKIGDPAADAMDVAVTKLKVDDADIQIAALRYFAAMGRQARKHVPKMIAAGATSNQAIRNAIDMTVSKLGPYTREDEKLLLGDGNDTSADLRGLRARLIPELEIPEEDRANLLAKYFKDPEKVVRADAALAIGKKDKENRDKFPRQDILRLAIPLLEDRDMMVRNAARQTLFNMGRLEVADLQYLKPYFESQSEHVHNFILTQVKDFGEKATPLVPELGKSLKINDENTKILALNAIIAVGRQLESLTPDIIPISRHDNPMLRVLALTILHRIGKDQPGVLSAFFDRLSDNDIAKEPPKSLKDQASASLTKPSGRRRQIRDLLPSTDTETRMWSVALDLLDQMLPLKSKASIDEVKQYLQRTEKRSILAQFVAATAIADATNVADPLAKAALPELVAALPTIEQVNSWPPLTTLRTPKSASEADFIRDIMELECLNRLCDAIGNCGESAQAAAPKLADLAIYKVIEDRAKSPLSPEWRLNHMVRRAALKALGRMGKAAEPALPSVQKLLSTELDPEMNKIGVEAVGEIGPPAAKLVSNFLPLFMKNRPDLNILLQNSIQKVGPMGAEPLVKYLTEYDVGWRKNVAPFRDEMLKAFGCLDGLAKLGPDGLSPSQRDAFVKNVLNGMRAEAMTGKNKNPEIQARTNILIGMYGKK